MEELKVQADERGFLRELLSGSVGLKMESSGPVVWNDRAESLSAVASFVLLGLTRKVFPDGASAADVVRWVAESRVRSDDVDGELDPRLAELLVSASLGDMSAAEAIGESGLAREEKLVLHLRLIQRLAGDVELGAGEKEEILDRAYNDASEMFSSQ